MNIALITGSAGLIGSCAARFFHDKGYRVVGIDNDMRRYFFGDEASTRWNRRALEDRLPNYTHHEADIRDAAALGAVFATYGSDIRIVIHTAAQPSHDWAAREPVTDFSVNALGTLHMLEATRAACPKATFIFTSTNKVYGDNPNLLPLEELEDRWEVAPGHPFARHGIDETMSLDHCTHSIFGVSKTAADLMVQEYGRYFGMNTGVFRGGCLTGGDHSGTELHGFLSYLMRACVEGRHYRIYGYKGKQVRDNIHASDLINMFWHFHQAPRPGAAYNAGGSRHSHCSMREAIAKCEALVGKRLECEYVETNRTGDHIWYVSDVRKFQADYPDWRYTYDLDAILAAIYRGWIERKDMA